MNGLERNEGTEWAEIRSLLKNERLDWQGRAHLLSMTAIAMRRIFVDYARRRATDKRGSGLAIITLDDSLLPHESRPEEFLQLDEALTSLGTHNPRLASVVTYEFDDPDLRKSCRQLRRGGGKRANWTAGFKATLGAGLPPPFSTYT